MCTRVSKKVIGAGTGTGKIEDVLPEPGGLCAWPDHLVKPVHFEDGRWHARPDRSAQQLMGTAGGIEVVRSSWSSAAGGAAPKTGTP